MKTTLITILILFSLTTVKSQIIKIGQDKIQINGRQLDSTSLIMDYINALGQPSSIKNLINNIYLFDSLGIYIYEDYKDNNKIIEISFDFKKDNEYDFSPKKTFKGKIYLTDYNCELSRHTSYRRLKKICNENNNKTLQMEFGDADFNYGNFNLLFEQGFLRTSTSNFTLDFKARKYKYIQ